MTDRVLLGKAEDGDVGLWVSKPGANVVALVGNSYLESLGDWYGYQEEFDGDGTDGVFSTTESFSGLYAPGIAHGAIRTTSNGTVIYTGNTGDVWFRTKINYSGGNINAKPNSGEVFIGSEYPIVEMRVRMLHDPGIANMADHWKAHRLFFVNADLNGTNALGESGAATRFKSLPNQFGNPPEVGVWKILEWDMSDLIGWMDPYLENSSVGSYSSAFRISQLRFDLAELPAIPSWNSTTDPMWEIDYVRVKKKGIPQNAGKYGSVQDAMLFDSDWTSTALVHQTGTVTIGTAKALINGNTSNRVVGHNIDNDANGYVTFPELPYVPLILFQRIDENVTTTGSSYPGGEDEFSICTQNWEDHRYPTTDLSTTDAADKGFDIQIVDSPIVANSYIKDAESSLPPELLEMMNASQSGNPLFELFSIVFGFPVLAGDGYIPIQKNNIITWDHGPGSSRSLHAALIYFPIDTQAIIQGILDHIDVIVESDLIATTNIDDYMDSAFSVYNARQDSVPNMWFAFDPIPLTDPFPTDHELPWTGSISAPSKRAGKKFSDMVDSFYEVRTFAYARAKKDGFWLTSRNAIAQEGSEPALNLAPVLPEEGTANQGSAAFSNMASNNDNGAWGMFHPALALYDGNKFAEGLQLKWDTRMTANSFLLDKVGKGIESDGSSVYDPDPYLPSIVNYDQYKWRPEFSCSGLPFSGSLARPNDPAPTNKSKFPDSLFMPVFKPPPDFDAFQIPQGGSIYGGSYTHSPSISYTANGQLRGDSGGFYPYRYQKHPMFHISEEGGIFEKVIDGSITPKEEIMTLFANYAAAPFESEEAGLIAGQIVNDHIIRDKFYIGYQYNIRRLSSPGIFHPHGSVPENNEAVDNRNVPTSGPDIKNQTAYIGGAMNTKAGSSTIAYTNRAGVLRWNPGVPGFEIGIEYESAAEEAQLESLMNSGAGGTIKILSTIFNYPAGGISRTSVAGFPEQFYRFVLDIENPDWDGPGTEVFLPVVTPSVASYDATKPKPPKYKYWVLRIPVSIPEYTS